MTTPASASLRLFLALWPAPATAVQLQAIADAWEWTPEARRTQPERLHITLHFIGQVPAGQLGALQQALALPWQGCELVLDRAEVWPGGIAVLEASRVPAALQELHAALADRLRGCGLPVETRRFRPHVTFARKARGARPAAIAAPLHWQADARYALVQSLPGGRGYLPLQWFG